MSVTQAMEQFQEIVTEEARQLARETGAVQRVHEGGFDGASLAQMFLFGYWEEPNGRLDQLAQIAARGEVAVSASAICQRLTAPTAEFLRRLLVRLAEVRVEAEAVEVPLLKQFAAVIVEDSSTISLPAALAERWRGCGGSEGTSAAALKLFVRWDVLAGGLQGPRLSDGRTNDHQSPFNDTPLPVGALYLADLGFFGIQRLSRLAHGEAASGGQQEQAGKRYFLTRYFARTTMWTRGGHRLDLGALLPKQVGEVREQGVLLGKRERLPVRLIMVRVPEEVALARQERLREAAQKHGRVPDEDVLALTHWTILLTNLPRKRADCCQVLVLVRLRWQIERLFRLWKEDGQIDVWRSRKPMAILCELYSKLGAMLIQQALIEEGCWADPFHSLVKAAQVARREANRLMIAFAEGELARTVRSIACGMRAGCRIQKRKGRPSTAQLLLHGLDWPLHVLLA